LNHRKFSVYVAESNSESLQGELRHGLDLLNILGKLRLIGHRPTLSFDHLVGKDSRKGARFRSGSGAAVSAASTDRPVFPPTAATSLHRRELALGANRRHPTGGLICKEVAN
jgi:hypothetical protein